MSERRHSPNLLLNSPDYNDLDCGPKNVADWFAAWDQAKARRDSMSLLSLTHWGLQLPFHLEERGSLVQLFIHYLALADGHQSPANFGQNNFERTTIFGQLTDGDIKQKIADKAWMELCNRVFVFNEAGEVRYHWLFLDPRLAAAFINFIDAGRWDGGELFQYNHVNILRDDTSSYHAKALAFTRHLLKDFWRYKEIVQGKIQNWTVTEDRKAELQKNVRFFSFLKPELVKHMVYYRLVRFLHDKVLSSKVRRVMLEMALSNSFLHRPMPLCLPVDLAQAYTEIEPIIGGSLYYGNREVLRILLLYPLVVAARRKDVHLSFRRRLEERAAKTAELKVKVERAMAELNALARY